MGLKTSRWKISGPDLPSVTEEFMAVPRNFAFGLMFGLLVPVAAVAGVVAGIYVITRKVPFITEMVEEDEGRHLILKLVEPEEARSLFQRGKDAVQAFGDEVRVELEGEL